MRPLWWMLTLAYCAFIFWMSSGPAPLPKPMSLFGMDKLLHAGAYGVLACIVLAGMRRSGRGWGRPALFLLPLLFASLYGVTDEIHQYFVPTRQFDPFDALANAFGAVLAAGAGLFLPMPRRSV